MKTKAKHLVQESDSANDSDPDLEGNKSEDQGRYLKVKCVYCGQVFQKDYSSKHMLQFHWKTMSVENGKIRTVEGVDYKRLPSEDQKLPTRAFNSEIIVRLSLKKIPQNLSKKEAITQR